MILLQGRADIYWRVELIFTGGEGRADIYGWRGLIFMEGKAGISVEGRADISGG